MKKIATILLSFIFLNFIPSFAFAKPGFCIDAKTGINTIQPGSTTLSGF
ncbi:MAG: hypothetical protein SFW07_03700 [Gammaproteobacteria bacterium]|nr:hypothetical protein [Gammaproteobacteria bacterium]